MTLAVGVIAMARDPSTSFRHPPISIPLGMTTKRKWCAEQNAESARRLAPGDASAWTCRMKMRIGVLDESIGAKLQAFRPETGSLFSGHTRRHVWADPAFRCHYAMPGQIGGFFIREA